MTVYVELINEGTRYIRPTLAEPRDDGSYLLMATANYNPEDERWQFPPGHSREVLEGDLERWRSARCAGAGRVAVVRCATHPL